MNTIGKLFASAACWMAMVYAESPAAQPVPFSHKTHVAAGLTCVACHTMAQPGDLAGFPNGSFCMGCHSNIKSDSPAIQTLAGFVRDHKRISWVRIYKLPQFVYFSHQVHFKDAGIECADCHGPVSERNVLVKEKSTTMADCMKCHDQRKAPNGCDVCHDSH
jgi:hypothetical protein